MSPVVVDLQPTLEVLDVAAGRLRNLRLEPRELPEHPAKATPAAQRLRGLHEDAEHDPDVPRSVDTTPEGRQRTSSP